MVPKGVEIIFISFESTILNITVLGNIFNVTQYVKHFSALNIVINLTDDINKFS